jgi:hypothetical protein
VDYAFNRFDFVVNAVVGLPGIMFESGQPQIDVAHSQDNMGVWRAGSRRAAGDQNNDDIGILKRSRIAHIREL